jgi:serine/threonine-protein phosphatase 2A regulatory subunit B'
MLNNETLMSLVATHRVEILPLLFGPLYHNCTNHWHATVQSLTLNILKLFMEMDAQLFDQCSELFLEREGKLQEKSEERHRGWLMLEQRCRPSIVPQVQ